MGYSEGSASASGSVPRKLHGPAEMLAAECPRRISASLHARGDYMHYFCARTCRVCCYACQAGGGPPLAGRLGEGDVPTAAQASLWAQCGEKDSDGRRAD